MAVLVTRHVVFLFLLSILVAVESARSQSSLKIAAFNIENFGLAKARNAAIVSNLTSIIIRYDLVLLQEVLNDEAFVLLSESLDRQAGQDAYSSYLSQGHGTSPSHKERYAYFYRPIKFTVVDVHQWRGQNFAYPPYALKLRPRNSAIGEFGFIGAHLRPSRPRERITAREMNALVDVYAHLSRTWNIQNFIIAGDLNAGCNFVRPGEWGSIRLRTISSFKWFIQDSAKTNLALGSSCPYDRIIGIGDDLVRKIGCTGVFKFDDEFGLTYKQARRVSDHYPVQTELVLRS